MKATKRQPHLGTIGKITWPGGEWERLEWDEIDEQNNQDGYDTNRCGWGAGALRAVNRRVFCVGMCLAVAIARCGGLSVGGSAKHEGTHSRRRR